MTVFQASVVLPAKDPPPYCFPCCFPPFRLQNQDNRGTIFSTLPQCDDAPSKIGIQGGRHNFAPTNTVNLLSKITLRIWFLPLKYSLVSSSAIFTFTSTVSTRTSTILRSIDTCVVWVTIFNHYCSDLHQELQKRDYCQCTNKRGLGSQFSESSPESKGVKTRQPATNMQVPRPMQVGGQV